MLPLPKPMRGDTTPRTQLNPFAGSPASGEGTSGGGEPGVGGTDGWTHGQRLDVHPLAHAPPTLSPQW